MKKILMLVACAAAVTACQQKHSLTVNMSDLTNDTVTVGLLNQEMNGIEHTDTVIAKNGVFTYDYSGDNACVAVLNMTGEEGPSRMQVYLVPGENGTLTGTLKDGAKWSGSAFYTELAALETITDPISKKMSELGLSFHQQVEAGANPDSLQGIIMPQYQKLAEERSEALKNFVKENPASNVSATLLMQLEDPAEALEQLDEKVKTGVFANLVEQVQKRVDEMKAREASAKLVADGCVAPDFTLKDLDGNDLTLSSLRGKYVVLDFWGSWCGWCIKGMPEMKKYYKKYAGKLEILGVDCSDTEEKWKAAVAENELPWKHVYNPKDSELLTTYAIEGFPTKIVLDAEGKIVKTIVGEDPAFYTLLDELLK